MTDLTSAFPARIRSLPPYVGAFDAHQLRGEFCDVLFATYSAGTSIEPHVHDTDNVGVITKGRLHLTVNGVESSFGCGEWYRVDAGTEHAARFDEDSAEIEFWFEARRTPTEPA